MGNLFCKKPHNAPESNSIRGKSLSLLGGQYRLVEGWSKDPRRIPEGWSKEEWRTSRRRTKHAFASGYATYAHFYEKNSLFTKTLKKPVSE